MTTTASDPQIVPREPASLPALRAADQGVADALESVLSDNTRRNCSRLRGRVGLQSKYRAWLPLCERPDGP